MSSKSRRELIKKKIYWSILFFLLFIIRYKLAWEQGEKVLSVGGGQTSTDKTRLGSQLTGPRSRCRNTVSLETLESRERARPGLVDWLNYQEKGGENRVVGQKSTHVPTVSPKRPSVRKFIKIL